MINLEEVKRRLERDIEEKTEHIDNLENKLLKAQNKIEQQDEQLKSVRDKNEKFEKQVFDLSKSNFCNINTLNF